MPLASATRLTPHFTAGELGADKPEATGTVLANLTETARRLERIRDAVQSRIAVNDATHRNRGFRTATENEAAGGVETSDHLTGLAADGVLLDTAQTTAYQRLREAQRAGQLPVFDQIIFYPVQGHVHFGFGIRARREFRVRLYEGSGGTPLLTPELVAKLRGAL